MMENATGLVLLLEDCPKNLLCISMHMLLAGLKTLLFTQLLKFCYPSVIHSVTIFFSLESFVILSGTGRREVASIKESIPWLECEWL